VGDHAAANELVHRYTRLIYSILRDEFRIYDHDAEDIHQLTFQRLWSDNCAPLRHWNGGGLANYIGEIARNLALDFIRSRNRWSPRVQPVQPPAPGFDPELSRTVTRALRVLTERDCRLIRLKHLDGYTYREIAAQEGMNENAVGVALWRAEARFREILHKMDPDRFRDH